MQPHEVDPHRMCIDIRLNCIYYPGDVGTPTGSLEIIKLIINSGVSWHNARFVTFYVKNFYLEIPMDRSEYARIKLSNILQEFIDEYDPTTHPCNGWVYFKILRVWYGLPQADKLSNYILRILLKKSGYYEATTTPGLWRHKLHPIIFGLIVDNFGIEYVGKRHTQHLLHTLQEHYTITIDCEEKKFAGVDLDWKYADKHSQPNGQLSMEGV